MFKIEPNVMVFVSFFFFIVVMAAILDGLQEDSQSKIVTKCHFHRKKVFQNLLHLAWQLTLREFNLTSHDFFSPHIKINKVRL